MTRRVLTWSRAHAHALTFLGTAILSFLASDCALRAADRASTNDAPRLALSPPSSALILHAPALFPETVVHDAARDRLLVGSFRRGAIFAVDDAGGATAIVDEPRLCSILGIAIDDARGRVWAVNADLGASAKPSAAGAKKLAAVGVYDLATGALVVKKSDGQIFKVPLDRPDAVSTVAVSTRFIGGDGLLLVDGRSLVVVANRTPEAATNAVFALSSDDGFASGRVDARVDLGEVYPTTAVLRDGRLYVVHSWLNEPIQGAPDVQDALRTEAAHDRVGEVRR